MIIALIATMMSNIILFLYMVQVSCIPKTKTPGSFQFCLPPACSTQISNTKTIIFHLHGKKSDPIQCLRKSRLLTIFMEVWREENTYTPAWSRRSSL